MPKTTQSERSAEALRASPDEFLANLKEGIITCRAMVWSIIQAKQFDGFSDAEGLIKAYDHLNKTLSIFSKFQLPLPGMSKKESEAEKAMNPHLPMV